ncbi:sensor histidine kinase [Robinsoniella peoriensis]|uniref:sensor histidine kinase n=1 Tax=Robinsoniella TaxID=588605 RepID=UPI000A9511BC
MRNFMGKAKQSIGNMSIQTKLVVMTISLVFLSVFLITAYFYASSSSQIIDNSRNYIRNTMRQAGQNVTNNVEAAERVLFDISTDREIQKYMEKVNEGKMNAYEEVQVGIKIKNKLISQITKINAILAAFLYDLNGNAYITKDGNYGEPYDIPTGVIYEAKGANVWFDRKMDLSVIPVGKLIYNTATQKPLGYLILYVDTDYIEKIIKDIVFTKMDQIFLVNSRGSRIAGDLNNELPPKEMMHAFKGNDTLHHVNIDGNNKQLCVIPLKTVDWTLISLSEDERHNEQLLNLRNITIVILAVILSVITTLSILVARGISKPVKELVQSMEKFGAGDFSVYATVKYKDEIGQLRGSFNKMVSDMEHLVHNVCEEKSLKQQAQIKALQMQINPHFLYNTLDTIQWLANMHDEKDIAEVTRSLGYLMRFSLLEQELISFEEELDAVEAYIRIQKYRYGQELKIDIDVEEEVLYERVPCHIILPLLENAIEHGLSNKASDKQVKVTGSMKKNVMCLQIIDNGIGMQQEKIDDIMNGKLEQKKGNHMSIGIQNVNKRLKLKYGEAYGLRLKSREGEGTCVSIVIPVERTENEIL